MIYETTHALLSDDRTYRYRLDRVWNKSSHRRMVVIGLNPSTADETVDDPTIRRCVQFAKREDCGGLIMVNLFAFRATDPRACAQHYATEEAKADLYFHERNDVTICSACGVMERGGGPVVAAWGAHDMAVSRGDYVRRMLRTRGIDMFALGVTKAGHPKHPLYLRSDTLLVEWPHART